MRPFQGIFDTFFLGWIVYFILLGATSLQAEEVGSDGYTPSKLKPCQHEAGRKDYTECNFRLADLSNKDFSNTDLSNADLIKADFFGANLSGANLSGALLNWANLQQANLSGANLSGATLTFANLSEANLTGANLTSVYMFRSVHFDTNFKEAILAGAIWEDGIRCKDESKGQCLPSQVTDKVDSIYIIGEARPGLMNDDGSGLYSALLQAIYETAGVKTKFVTAPYPRVVLNIQQKQVDCVVGVPLKSIPDVIYSQFPIDQDVTIAIFKKDRLPEWKSPESAKNKMVGWLRGYSYEKLFKETKDITEVNSRKSSLAMLDKDRLDVLVDLKRPLQNEAAVMKFDLAAYRQEELTQNLLYLGFSDNQRGEQLKKIFDEGFAQLVNSGKIKTIYETWKSGYTPKL